MTTNIKDSVNATLSQNNTQTHYGPALAKVLAAFPDAREKHNGYYEHANNPRFDFRVRENGSIFIHSWTGRTEDEILAMGGLKRADVRLKETYPGPTQDSLDLLNLAIAKCIDPRFLSNLGLLSIPRFASAKRLKGIINSVGMRAHPAISCHMD
jgi:hypothetical protein